MPPTPLKSLVPSLTRLRLRPTRVMYSTLDIVDDVARHQCNSRWRRLRSPRDQAQCIRFYQLHRGWASQCDERDRRASVFCVCIAGLRHFVLATQQRDWITLWGTTGRLHIRAAVRPWSRPGRNNLFPRLPVMALNSGVPRRSKWSGIETAADDRPASSTPPPLTQAV
jgi:hypothetical protein